MHPMEWIVSKLVELAGRNFHGSLTINFQAGKPMNVETREIEKPPQS